MTFLEKTIKRERGLDKLVQHSDKPLPGEHDAVYNCRTQKVVMKINARLEANGARRQHIEDGWILEKKHGRT